ncbi:hypothetical protein ACWQV9_10190 [Brevundimonas diminuta]
MAPLFGSFPTVKVHARAAYPSWDYKDPKWRQQDYDTHFFVHAVKNDAARIGDRKTQLPMGAGGARVWIGRDNLEVCQHWFSRWAAMKCHNLGVENPVFVAIPNRNALTDTKSFNTARLARFAARAFGDGAQAYVGLRFKEYVPKEKGKRQSVSELVGNLVLVEDIPAGTLVLIDDVYTVGRHVTAAWKVLPKERRPDHAFVAGKTEKGPLADMTVVPVEHHWCLG